MSLPACPCGVDHAFAETADDRKTLAELERVLDLAGDPLIDVTLPDGRIYRVPRVYIALHGLKAADVPALANRYYWMLKGVVS